ncbi:MAG: PEP/pyruvate-binding domain-containing protein [Candidatus Micrarchaeota archaeon]|nr:PEP/pyruvate-binding domain-containing protein [Candidatus Micrarchaeota archaeon]
MPKRLVKGGQLLAVKSDLASVLRNRQLQLETLDSKHWTIIGNGSIGAKAEELRRKAWAIEQAGFTLYPRVVFAMGFFDDFKRRNEVMAAVEKGIQPNAIQQLIRNAIFNADELANITEIAKRFIRVPIVVRSSAHGDCRGTGIYESGYVVNSLPSLAENIDTIVSEIKVTLASEFSEDAIEFRKKCGLPPGMAVIIEPVFGIQIPDGIISSDIPYIPRAFFFGPLYGGHGHTSTASGPGYTIISAGLPTSTVLGKGIKAVEGEDDGFLGRIPLTKKHANTELSLICGSVVYPSGNTIMNVKLPPNAIFGMTLEWLFSRLKKLESLLGKPQYYEFAVIEKDGNPIPALVQIADISLSHDFYEFPNTERLVARGTQVEQGGNITCRDMVYVTSPGDLRLLDSFNKTHSNYILVINCNLLSAGNKISFSYLSNAAVVAELGYKPHAASLAAHFGGSLIESGKLVLSLDELDRVKLEKYETAICNFRVFTTNARVIASAKQQKVIIELTD